MPQPRTIDTFTSTKTNRIRVAGSGFTIFLWDNIPIAFAQQVSHTSPQPVGPGPVAIQPIDEPYPIQVITPAAAGMGSITLNLYEVYGSKVWDRLSPDLAGSNDIVDIFMNIAARANEINLVKVIKPPVLRGGAPGGNTYAEIYHGCIITNIVDGEQVEVGTMEILKQITVGYRYVTRDQGSSGNTNSGRGFAHRDAALNTFAGIKNDEG